MEIIVKKLLLKGRKKTALFFPFNFEIKELLKERFDAKWNLENKCWYLDGDNSLLEELKTALQGKAKLIITEEKIGYPSNHYELPYITDDYKLQKIRKLKIWMENRRYSPNTLKVYMESITTFLRFHNSKPLDDITNDDVLKFNSEYILKRGLSSTYQSQFVNALNLFYKVNKIKKLIIEEVPRPKKEKRLPNVLSKLEIKAILEAPVNLKHRAMLALIYSCGLRCSELINLKPSEIESARGVIKIKESKGKKDRIVPLSMKVLELLRTYYNTSKPQVWLFEGEKKGERYSARSLQQVIKSAVKKAGIKKPVTLHWLRHSYATHLLESGTDLRYIQTLLGHNSSRTTEIYTHVSTNAITRIKSPFDDL